MEFYKIVVVDRNGHVSKLSSKNAPVITDSTITITPTPNYTLVFVIANLTSYSVTELNKKRDAGNEKE